MNALLLLALLVPSEPPPIKALLITGGCCHDYNVQKLIISEGTAARARIEWVIVQDGGTKTNSRIALHEKSDWAKGFDVVIHNECFADVKDPAWTDNIVKPHREGTGAVLIHCAMHCYRDGIRWWQRATTACRWPPPKARKPKRTRSACGPTSTARDASLAPRSVITTVKWLTRSSWIC